MERAPLMPKATAVWLVDNTSLTFDQIAEFCGLHVLEVKGIADGDVAHGIKGMDPISSGQLSREEIAAAEDNSSHRLKLSEPKVEVPEVKTKRGPRYTPVSRRQDRPNAILWLLRNHPELKDSQIMRLVGTTKPTILAIRERSHWNSPNLQPQDPVTLGLCSQIDLDAEVKKAAARLDRERKEVRHRRAAQGRHAAPCRREHCRRTSPARARTADGDGSGARGARCHECSRRGGGDARHRLGVRQAQGLQADRRHLRLTQVSAELTVVKAAASPAREMTCLCHSREDVSCAYLSLVVVVFIGFAGALAYYAHH